MVKREREREREEGRERQREGKNEREGRSKKKRHRLFAGRGERGKVEKEEEKEILPWSPRDVILFKDNGCEVDACQLGNAFGPDFYSPVPRPSWPRNLRADGSATLPRLLRPIHVTNRKRKKKKVNDTPFHRCGGRAPVLTRRFFFGFDSAACVYNGITYTYRVEYSSHSVIFTDSRDDALWRKRSLILYVRSTYIL